MNIISTCWEMPMSIPKTCQWGKWMIHARERVPLIGVGDVVREEVAEVFFLGILRSMDRRSDQGEYDDGKQELFELHQVWPIRLALWRRKWWISTAR